MHIIAYEIDMIHCSSISNEFEHKLINIVTAMTTDLLVVMAHSALHQLDTSHRPH